MADFMDDDTNLDDWLDAEDARIREARAAAKAGKTAPEPSGPKSEPPAAMLSGWDSGTDLRIDGLYEWPHISQRAAGEDPSRYVSVTRVIDETGDGMYEAKAWFAAAAVRDLVIAAGIREPIKIYHNGDRWKQGLNRMVEVQPVDILRNTLPTLPDRSMDWEDGETVYWPKNFGMHYIKGAGIRHLTRLANIGSIMHDAAEEYARYANGDSRNEVIRWNMSDLPDWIKSRIEARGFAITIDDCIERVMTVLEWCEENLEEVMFFEAPVFSDAYCYAGTLDIHAKLKGRDGICQLDFKSSKDPYASHFMQHAAYFFAETIGIRGTDRRVEMPRADYVANLYIKPKETSGKLSNPFEQPDLIGHGEIIADLHLWPMEGIQEAFDGFLYARAHWQWRNDGHKPVRSNKLKIATPKPGSLRLPKPVQRKLERI